MFCVLQELVKGTVVSRKIIVLKAFDSLTKHSALPKLGRRYVDVDVYYSIRSLFGSCLLVHGYQLIVNLSKLFY